MVNTFSAPSTTDSAPLFPRKATVVFVFCNVTPLCRVSDLAVVPLPFVSMFSVGARTELTLSNVIRPSIRLELMLIEDIEPGVLLLSMSTLEFAAFVGMLSPAQLADTPHEVPSPLVLPSQEVVTCASALQGKMSHTNRNAMQGEGNC